MKKIKLNISGHSTITDWQEGWSAVESLLSAHTEGRLTPDSTLAGTLNVPIAPPSKVAALKAAFPDLTIETDETLVQFEDREVARVISENAGGGEPISKEAASKLTSIGTWFNGNTDIKSFDELSQFGVKILADGAFQGCNNLVLTSDMLEGITSLKGNSLYMPIPSVLFLPNVTSMIAPFGPEMRQMYSVLFMPKVKLAGGYCFRGKAPKLVDYICSSISEYSFYNTNYAGSTFVFRTKTKITSIHASCVSHVKTIGKIFVQPEIYEEQITVSGFDAGNVHPISGDQWKTEFGSADEYADIRKYVTDPAEQERIIQAYQEA